MTPFPFSCFCLMRPRFPFRSRFLPVPRNDLVFLFSFPLIRALFRRAVPRGKILPNSLARTIPDVTRYVRVGLCS